MDVRSRADGAARQHHSLRPRVAHRGERRDAVHDVGGDHACRHRVPAGTYTLWTIPRAKGADLIVNKQTGQWGTGYDRAQDLGSASLKTETLGAPVEQFTISIVAATRIMER